MNSFTTNTKNGEDYFQPLTSIGHFFRHSLALYVGHWETFLALTIATAVPTWLLHNTALTHHRVWLAGFLIGKIMWPLTQISAQGTVMAATAMIYVGEIKDQPSVFVNCQKALQLGISKNLAARWLVQVLGSSAMYYYILTPLGIWTFASHILLLDVSSKHSLSVLSRAILQSMRLTLWQSPKTTLSILLLTTTIFCLHYIILPILGYQWEERYWHLSNKNEGYLDDSRIIATYKHHLYQTQFLSTYLLWPMETCLWTILYFHISGKCQGSRLTRQSLSQTLKLPTALSNTDKVH